MCLFPTAKLIQCKATGLCRELQTSCCQLKNPGGQRGGGLGREGEKEGGSRRQTDTERRTENQPLGLSCISQFC